MQAALFPYLSGRWRVARTIVDHWGSQNATFDGEATFSPFASDNATVLAYRESGTLRIGAAELVAERDYRWECDGNEADVTFADGRFFHRVSNREARHLCGDDTYLANYRFGSANNWGVVWAVKGPKKNYVSTTFYERMM